MSKLGSVLLKMRLVSAEQLEEGLDARVLNGGRLGTNLLELGYLSEAQLADALQALHGLPTLHGEILPAPEALALLKAEWCDKHELMPLRLEGGRLYIGVTTPFTPEQLALLAQRLGHALQQMVLPEFRMNQLLRRYAGAFRPVRAVDLSHGSASPAAASPEEKPAEELMSEEAFQSLYARAMTGGRGAILEEAPGEPAGEEAVTLGAMPSARPPPLKPLDFAEAQAALAKLHDRDGIAATIMAFAAGRFARALLFTVHGDMAVGWVGVGEGLTGSKARRVAMPLKGASTFKLVRETRSHFIGPIKKDGAVAVFFKRVGGAPQTSILMPVLARGRVVNILYCDSGPDRPAVPEISELLILTQKMGRSYEAILAQRKRAGA